MASTIVASADVPESPPAARPSAMTKEPRVQTNFMPTADQTPTRKTPKVQNGPAAATVKANATTTTIKHVNPPAQKPSALKSWWRRLIHPSHSSGNPDTEPAQTSAMHKTTYTPRHAGRDSMLAVPLAERTRHTTGTRTPGVKSALPGGDMAVHPNKEVVMQSLKSYEVSLAKKRGSGSGGKGTKSGTGSQTMGSIAEDEAVEGSAEGPATVTFAVRRPAAAGVARLRNGSRFYSYPSTAAAGSPKGRVSSGTTPLTTKSDGNADKSLSSTRLELKLQDLRSLGVARQLQQHVSPSRASAGAVRKGMTWDSRAGLQQSFTSSEESKLKGKGKARATGDPPNVSFAPSVRVVGDDGGETASLAKMSITARQGHLRDMPASPLSSHATASPSSGVSTLKPSDTYIPGPATTTTDDGDKPTLNTTKIATPTLEISDFPAPPFALHGRNTSVDTFASDSTPVDTKDSSVADDEMEGRSAMSSVTSAEGEGKDGETEEGKGTAKEERGEGGKVEAGGDGDEWARSVVEAAEAM